MKYIRYMLCLGLLLDHSLQPGNTCSRVKEPKKSFEYKENRLKNDSLDPNKLMALVVVSMENDCDFFQFTTFIDGLDKRPKTNQLDVDSITKARGLLVWALDEMDIEGITTEPVYRCWFHNVGKLADCVATYNSQDSVVFSDEFYQPLDMFDAYDKHIRGRLFSEDERISVALSRDVIVAWVDEVARNQQSSLLHSRVGDQSPTSEQLEQIENHPHAVNMEL